MSGNIEIDNMSANSRIWIYQSDRKLTNSEKDLVNVEISEFLSNWKAHGNELMAGFVFTKEHFLIVALDESFEAASGCSIDSCVRKIQEIGLKIGVDFFQRTNIAVMNEENEIVIVKKNEIQQKIEKKQITRQSKVFDNTISNIDQYQTRWIQLATDSWIKKYFK